MPPFRLLGFALALLLLLGACARTQPPPEPEQATLVQGTITHARGVPRTHDEAFVFTKDSHAIVQLWYSISTFGDAPNELLMQTTIDGVTGFPIPFKLEGNAETTFSRRGDYYLNVGVFSGDGGADGETFSVGDLVNEVYSPVPEAGATVRVEVTSLESCSAPQAGGYCIP